MGYEASPKTTYNLDKKADQHSNDVPPEYSSLGDIFAPEVVKTIEATIGGLDAELRELSLQIHGPSLDLSLQYYVVQDDPMMVQTTQSSSSKRSTFLYSYKSNYRS